MTTRPGHTFDRLCKCGRDHRLDEELPREPDAIAPDVAWRCHIGGCTTSGIDAASMYAHAGAHLDELPPVEVGSISVTELDLSRAHVNVDPDGTATLAGAVATSTHRHDAACLGRCPVTGDRVVMSHPRQHGKGEAMRGGGAS